MTTIILTIIGILLAAAAALMVIFYGGDAFNSGSIGAQANTLQNAGTNVISAIQLAKANDENVASYTTVDLIPVAYLKEKPALPTGSTSAFVGGAVNSKFTVTGVELPVCARVNKNLKRGVGDTTASLETAEATSSKMGCYKTGTSGTTGTFYSNM